MLDTGKSVGIGAKIFGGFIVLVLIGLMVGGVGFFSLKKVTDSSELESLTRSIQLKILDARLYEKNYIIQKDEESYRQLIQTLGEIGTAIEKLKAVAAQRSQADQIKRAEEFYRKAAEDLKRLEEDDAKALKTLQESASKITLTANEQSEKAAFGTKESILKTNADTLKAYALGRIKDVVSVGYDVLKHYHDKGLPLEAALEAVRNLHFDGSNYYFVVKEDLTLVAHGVDRKLEGKDFGKIQDKKSGKTFMREVVEGAVKSGESNTEYYWTKPGQGEAVFPKVTFAKHFKPWGLVICAGAYVDDIEQEVAKTGALIQSGIANLQQANAIKEYTDQARLNAVYYFAFGQQADKVGENIGKLKNLGMATDALKKEADTYLQEFNRRVKNNGERKNKIKEIQEAAGQALESARKIGMEASASLNKNSAGGKTMMIGFAIAGALAGLILATLLVKGITKPLKRVIAGLTHGSDQVYSASGQVASASQSLAEGSSQQAASLEETSSSLEEMASMARQNADNARQANSLMTDTGNVVERANTSMADLTQSMEEISAASGETAKIIKTIDEIAFQTNLLALNAAVEAARAGESGAGFAVVADEVRSLAMRAADAAKNTAVLIEKTVNKVQEGSELVNRTAEDFTQVAGSTIKVKELVAEIAAASQEQAEGVDQINRAVSEMDKVVQSNAANAEESASASKELSVQSEQMHGIVGDLVGLMGSRTNGDDPSRDGWQPQGQLLGAVAHFRKALPRPEKKNGASKGIPDSTRAVNPEQVIPLDDDNSFKEF